MLTRKETYRKKKKTLFMKILIAGISTMMILGGTLTVSFANEDLNAMLTTWFDEKQNDAIVNIRDAVSSEKEVQKSRLRDEMAKEMAAAEVELDRMTEAEKKQRIQNLRDYTDKLIGEINIDNSDEKQQIKQQLDSIYAEAKQALDAANANWKSSVMPVTPPTPEKPDDSAVPPAKPKTEEPVAAPETPAQPPTEDNAPPVEEPPPVEDGAPTGDAAGDGQ